MKRTVPAFSGLFGALLLASACSAALAIPLTDMRAEDLVPMAAEFRNELKLTPNQLSLWQRVESRSKAILRERKARRERLQKFLKGALAVPTVELRDLNKTIDTENAAAAQEDVQLRGMWLEINDALDDNQRHQVATMIGEQLIRVAPESNGGAPRGEEKGGKRGGGGGKRGGMGGMAGGGPGGAGGG
jgi:hypothetical protein